MTRLPGTDTELASGVDTDRTITALVHGAGSVSGERIATTLAGQRGGLTAEYLDRRDAVVSRPTTRRSRFVSRRTTRRSPSPSSTMGR